MDRRRVNRVKERFGASTRVTEYLREKATGRGGVKRQKSSDTPMRRLEVVGTGQREAGRERQVQESVRSKLYLD